MTGGKFANGAMTAALMQAVNGESENRAKESAAHTYHFKTWMCDMSSPACTMDNVFSIVNKYSVSFEVDPSEGRMILPPLNDPIFHVIDSENYEIYNITDEGHTFHPGQVEHKLTIESRTMLNLDSFKFVERQSIYLTTTGTGSGQMPYVNDAAGYMLFGFTHAKTQTEVQKMIKGN